MFQTLSEFLEMKSKWSFACSAAAPCCTRGGGRGLEEEVKQANTLKLGKASIRDGVIGKDWLVCCGANVVFWMLDQSKT